MHFNLGQKLIDKIRGKNQINKSMLFAKIHDLELHIQNINYKQNLIMDYFYNASEAKKASGALKKIQQSKLVLLSVIDKICKENNIYYWLDSGSLLGAVRHKGFIPWDDDCDIGMMNSDYRKFFDIVNSDKYPDFYCEEHIKNGVIYFKFEYDKNIGIDIFSYDDFDYKICKSFKATKLFPREALFIPKNIVFPTKRINFEDLELNIPNNADCYLRFNYGDYIKMPHSAPVWIHSKLKEFMESVEYQKSDINNNSKNRTITGEGSNPLV